MGVLLRQSLDPARGPYTLRGLADRAEADAVLIGDSITDVQAALHAAARCIGYANRPEKVASLANAGADALITTMQSLVRD
jgi:phosphoglycolate phosphatase-like HAD superfamily hydrolase